MTDDTAKTIWDFWTEVREFEKQPPEIKQQIIDLMLDPKTDLDYHYSWAAADIVDHVDATVSMSFVKNMFNTKWPREDYMSKVIVSAHKFDENKSAIQAMLMSAKAAMYKRMLLALDNLPIDNEIAGLRALSKIKYPPGIILEARYCPTLDALKKLPSIMRLEALECLMNVKLHGYNMFNRIADKEEFKNLLFSATLKYQERAEKIWQKYLELSVVGKIGLITVKAACPSCGIYEVKITNCVVHNEEALGKTQFSRITRKFCAICGDYLEVDPKISFETE